VATVDLSRGADHFTKQCSYAGNIGIMFNDAITVGGTAARAVVAQHFLQGLAEKVG
jgi:hypothetical protein